MYLKNEEIENEKMKVAAVVVTYNDDYKINEWYSHHQIYKHEVFLHIIVDNGSSVEYLNKVKSLFKDSIIIERNSNGGSTAAYNDGIKLALVDKSIDAIILLANDLKLEDNSISILYNEMKRTNAGMISPVLLEKDSLIISDFGCRITNSLFMKPNLKHTHVDTIKDASTIESDALAGGINMSSREFYEQVGLQDEKLFMYSDEVDMGIRARKHGFKLYSTLLTKSWHQHINPPSNSNLRHPFSGYLIARNKLYLARKHFGIIKVIVVLLKLLRINLRVYIKAIIKRDRGLFKYCRWYGKGIFNGLIGNMKKNKYSYPVY